MSSEYWDNVLDDIRRKKEAKALRHCSQKQKKRKKKQKQIDFVQNWQQLQQRVFDRDKHKCKKCGTKKGLLVHHKVAQQIAPHKVYQVSNCETLCYSCHQEVHKWWLESKAMRKEYTAVVSA